ncbi:FAD-dependent oxidoreductase [Arthrobacter psychrolactophilus]
MGSAAALSVARKGKSVLLFEQFAAGHSLGASHGASRNFNTAYQEPEYLTLVSEARVLSDQLAQETGMQLFGTSWDSSTTATSRPCRTSERCTSSMASRAPS